MSSSLSFVHRNNLNKILIAHLNIHPIRNKFECLLDKIKGNLDKLVISETKPDNSFPPRQFYIDGFGTPIRLDCKQ